MIAKSQFSAMTVLQLVLGEDGFVIGLPGRKQVEEDSSELVGGSRDPGALSLAASISRVEGPAIFRYHLPSFVKVITPAIPNPKQSGSGGLRRTTTPTSRHCSHGKYSHRVCTASPSAPTYGLSGS